MRRSDTGRIRIFGVRAVLVVIVLLFGAALVGFLISSISGDGGFAFTFSPGVFFSPSTFDGMRDAFANNVRDLNIFD